MDRVVAGRKAAEEICSSFQKGILGCQVQKFLLGHRRFDCASWLQDAGEVCTHPTPAASWRGDVARGISVLIDVIVASAFLWDC